MGIFLLKPIDRVLLPVFIMNHIERKRNMKKIWFILIPIIIFAFVVFAYYWYRYPAMFRILQDDSLSEAEVASLVESKKSQDLNLLVAYFLIPVQHKELLKKFGLKLVLIYFVSSVKKTILMFIRNRDQKYDIMIVPIKKTQLRRWTIRCCIYWISNMVSCYSSTCQYVSRKL